MVAFIRLDNYASAEREFTEGVGMTDERIRSIVPMFGGATSYVDTLDRILSYVSAVEPTHDEFVDWHREHFENVSKRGSIERRIDYLRNVGFIEQENGVWALSWAGKRYFEDKSREVLFDIMAERNIGLQSVLFELADNELTIDEINEFLLSTHEELNWDPDKTDMAQQRINWLRSMDLVERDGEIYRLTTQGQRFIDEVEVIRSIWESEDSFWGATGATQLGFTAAAYQTMAPGRYIDPEFRAVVLRRYNNTCPISSVDHPRLLDVAHILSWSDYPSYRADFANVLPLSKTHHAAFDAGFFTFDVDRHLRISPEFETTSDILQRTLVDRDGERIQFPDRARLSSDFIEQHNQRLDWWPV